MVLPTSDDLVFAIGHLVVEIGLMLERIGLQVAGFQRRIRHHIVGEFDDLDVEALLGGDGLGSFQHLRMRTRRHADLDGLG